MKKHLCIILAILMIMSLTVAAQPAVGAVGNDTVQEAAVYSYDLLNDGTAAINGCTYFGEDLVIPSEIDGITVTQIKGETFFGFNNLRSVTFPDTIRSICIDAFVNCPNLNVIELQDTAMDISAGSFDNIGYINNEANWDNGVLYIGKHLIAAKKDIEGSYQVKDGTITIADSAFSNCTKLTDAVVPDSVELIGANAFEKTGFYQNDQNWDGGILYAGRHLIAAKDNGTGEYTIRSDTKTICGDAFRGMERLTSIEIPVGVKRIGSLAFYFCQNLTAVTLPSSVTEIDDNAFFECGKLERIDIPAGVTVLGEGVFDDCGAMKEINVAEDNSVYCSVDGNLYSKDQSVLIQYAIGKNDESFSIPDIVRHLASYAFRYSEHIKTIHLPDGLLTIGTGAFDDCEELNNVVIPDSVKKIGQYAFNDTFSLDTISLPDTAIDIREKAFLNSAYQRNFDNWDDRVLYIGKHLIMVSPNKEGIYKVRDDTVTIAEGAARKCEKLTEVTIPDSVRRLGRFAFSDCYDLSSVTIGKGITTIDNWTFENCIAMKSMTIPQTVTTLGNFSVGYYFDADESSYTVLDDFVIRGKSGSAAERYAKTNQLTFEADQEDKVIQISDGMAQQIIRYSDPNAEGYTNENSEILRFIVYVETDYDTDLDGKPDLVKAFVQVPRSAVEGQYRAPVIYEASPYCAGESNDYFESAAEQLTDEEILSQPAKRVPKGTATTAEVSAKAKASDWHYTYENDIYQVAFYESTHSYDYFLVRGFAFVTCGGLGTKGSEGIQCSGSVPEREAFKDVIEWLHGDRTAYTDPDSNIAVSADWSSGKVGMIGLSYLGAMAYEVATTGVDGLVTVVPEAGVASWYDFSNSQGISTMLKYNYTTTLIDNCASRFFEKYDQSSFLNQQKYRKYLEDSQIALKGDYGDYWAIRDYAEADQIKATALIVQGLNDDRVRPKHFDLMWKAFERSGITPKAILHQNVHVTPFDTDKHTDIMIGDYTYFEILNRWFSHYLLDVDNGVEDMPAVTAQSNIDGKFYSYDSWEPDGTLTVKPDDGVPTKTVTAKDAVEDNGTLIEEVFIGKETDNSAYWKTDVTEPITIEGTVKVSLRLKCDNPDAKETSVAAVLVDTCDTEFNAFDYEFLQPKSVQIGTKSYIEGEQAYDIVQWTPEKTKKKIISYGIMDLKNPKAGYMPATATTNAEQIKADTWYDYEIFMQPNLYTVPAGHRLELYVIPYFNGSYGRDIAEIFTEEMIMQRYHCTLDGIARHMRDYSFTIDNNNSFAAIPTTKTPDGMLSEDNRILGDANIDGSVSILDATAIQRTLASLPVATFDETAADVDRDKIVSILDATYIQRHLVELSCPDGIGKYIAK